MADGCQVNLVLLTKKQLLPILRYFRHSKNMIAGINVDGFPGNSTSPITAQPKGSLADFLLIYVPS